MDELEKIVEAVKSELSGSNRGAHTLDHIIRVHHLCMELAQEIPVNRRVLEASALLHDIGRSREDETGISHAILSGDMSQEILKEIGYTENEIEQVVNAIRTHRFSEGLEPSSIEGKILSDADKLDAMGAIGIYRAIAQATSSNRGMEGFLRHANEKLLKLHTLMYTEEAKELARKRHQILSSFVALLREEIAGGF